MTREEVIMTVAKDLVIEAMRQKILPAANLKADKTAMLRDYYEPALKAMTVLAADILDAIPPKKS